MLKPYNFTCKILLLLLFLFSQNFLFAASPDEGKALFKQYCAQCHAKSMKDDLTGPALAGVQERWESQELLYAWIRNSQEVIASGNDYAVSIYNEWNKVAMNAFPNLTDDEIASILLYIDGVAAGTYPPKKPGEEVAAVAEEEPRDNTLLYVILLGVLALLALILARVITNLNQIAQAQEGQELGERKSLVDILTSRGVVAFVIFALVVLGGYTTVNNAINLNRQQGYAPEQPIIFSHATHAGLQKIDCQYCHDGARRSKHSVIPAANTCMNCHRAIKNGSEYGTAELVKVFASIGYNPATDSYMQVDTMSEEELEKIYKDWIVEEFMKEEDDIQEADRVATQQWDDLVESLTTDVKKEIYGPIPWVRIHNLQDHVYYNHAQHVTVGNLECQTCHGPVEEMEVVYQYSPLSMGWCINCHRKTEVDFKGNDYYTTYQNYHEEIKAGKREQVTVDEIGGLECQKCHY